MPITSFKQFLDFLKYILLHPLKLKFSILGLYILGLFLFINTQLLMARVGNEYAKRVNTTYDPNELSTYKFSNPVFFSDVLDNLAYEIWAVLIFMVISTVGFSNRSLRLTVIDMIKRHHKALGGYLVLKLCLYIPFLTFSYAVAQPTMAYHLAINMIFAVEILFIFSFLEIVRNDKDIFEAIGQSARLLKGKYIFTFVVLLILMTALDYLFVGTKQLYSGWSMKLWEMTDEAFHAQEMLMKQLVIIWVSIDTIAKLVYNMIFYSAVIYLYNLYIKSNAEKATNSSPQKPLSG